MRAGVRGANGAWHAFWKIYHASARGRMGRAWFSESVPALAHTSRSGDTLVNGWNQPIISGRKAEMEGSEHPTSHPCLLPVNDGYQPEAKWEGGPLPRPV